MSSVTVSIISNWETGANASLEIIPDRDGYIELSYLGPGKISWCDSFDQLTPGTLTMQSWVPSLKKNVGFKASFGFEINDLKDLNLKNLFNVKYVLREINNGKTSIPGELVVSGLNTKDLFKLYNVGDTFVLENCISVHTNNPNVIKITNVSDSNKKFSIKIIAIGTGCLKIKTELGTRLFGIFVKGSENQFIIGSVSEDDPSTSISFWSELEDVVPQKNKYVNMRYIYLNNGPGDYGWRYNYTTPEYNLEPLGQRATRFIRNSLRLGMYPCFVYYNIPDSGESYFTNGEHIISKEYMENYFKDLGFLLKLITSETSGIIPTTLIFEPDFIGYLMQNSGKIPSEIPALYQNSNGKIVEGSVRDLVRSINILCNGYRPAVRFGWQINVWSSSYSGKTIPGGLGLIKVTDSIGFTGGLKIITREGKEIAKYYLLAGITFLADFFSVDKYGLSFRGVTGEALTNAITSNWGWNSDHWNNYIYYCRILSSNLKKKCILWQLPSAHLNSSTSISPYTGLPFKDIQNIPGAYEDSSATFFFGDTFIPSKFEYNYFSKNEHKMPGVSSGNGKITWPGVITKNGINNGINNNDFIIGSLFGAGVGADTHSGGLARSITDEYFFISKVQETFLKN